MLDAEVRVEGQRHQQLGGGALGGRRAMHELVGDVENEKREFALEEAGITKTAFEIRLGGRFVGVGARE